MANQPYQCEDDELCQDCGTCTCLKTITKMRPFMKKQALSELDAGNNNVKQQVVEDNYGNKFTVTSYTGADFVRNLLGEPRPWPSDLAAAEAKCPSLKEKTSKNKPQKEETRKKQKEKPKQKKPKTEVEPGEEPIGIEKPSQAFLPVQDAGYIPGKCTPMSAEEMLEMAEEAAKDVGDY